jgi:hypothetical protein
MHKRTDIGCRRHVSIKDTALHWVHVQSHAAAAMMPAATGPELTS